MLEWYQKKKYKKSISILYLELNEEEEEAAAGESAAIYIRRMSSPVMNSRKNSTSPPLVSNQTVCSAVTTSETSNKTLDLEEVVSLFASLISDRTQINDHNFIHFIAKPNSTSENSQPIASSSLKVFDFFNLTSYLSIKIYWKLIDLFYVKYVFKFIKLQKLFFCCYLL